MDVSSAMGGYSDWRACSSNPIEQIASISHVPLPMVES
jgi:hypothetical protein